MTRHYPCCGLYLGLNRNIGDEMLTFISYTGNKTADGHKIATFMCGCGAVQDFSATRVKNGYVNFCKQCSASIVAEKIKTHGMKYSDEYRTWSGIKNRCKNTASKDYYRYGGSGILMCDEWANNFASFFAYLGKKPSSKHSVDRIDNDKGYEPGNVRWATPTEQAQNKKNTTYVTDGKNVYRINEVAKLLNITRGAAHLRLKRGKLDGFTTHTRVEG